MITDHDVYKIGSLTRTHGVRGEVAFQFTDDVWDRVEADYLFLRLDGLLVPFFLEEWRFRSDDVALLKFEDIEFNLGVRWMPVKYVENYARQLFEDDTIAVDFSKN